MNSYRVAKRWRCRRCLSQNIAVAVEWGESVESVDQGEDVLMPDGSGGGDVSRLLDGFCNDCRAHDDPYELFERVRTTI